VGARCHDALMTDAPEPEEQRPEGEDPAQPPEDEVPASEALAATSKEPVDELPAGMTVAEARAAALDPHHPHHAAAKAAEARWAASVTKAFAGSAYEETFRRIGENVARLVMPPSVGENLARQIMAPSEAVPPLLRVPRVPGPPPLVGADVFVDATPRKTLEALVDVSERMSEMVRVASEHRDAAVQQTEQYQVDSRRGRRRDRWMLGAAMASAVAAWVAVVIAVIVAARAR